MTPRIRKAAVVASSVAVLGAAGIGVAAAADSSPGTTGSTTTGPAPGAAPGGPGRDHRGPGPLGEHLAAVAKTLGVSAEKLRAAVRDARPDKDDRPARPARGSDPRAAEIAKALGVEAAKVQEILEVNRPARPDRGERPRPPKGERPAPKDGERPPAGRGPGGPGGPGFGPGGPGAPGPGGPGGPRGPRVDDAKLVAALAKGLSISEEKVKAALADLRTAHEREHAARRTAFYAAIAKELGLEASAVQKAFEAAAPKPPKAP